MKVKTIVKVKVQGNGTSNGIIVSKNGSELVVLVDGPEGIVATVTQESECEPMKRIRKELRERLEAAAAKVQTDPQSAGWSLKGRKCYKFKRGDRVALISDPEQNVATLIKHHNSELVEVKFDCKDRPTFHNPDYLQLIERPVKEKGAGGGARIEMFGLPVTSVIRWMAKEGSTAKRTIAVMAECGIMVKDGTVRTQTSRANRGVGSIPELNDTDAENLRALIAFDPATAE